MRRTPILILVLLALTGGCVASAEAASRPPKPTLQVLVTHRYGDILIAGNGYMIYGFSADTPRHDACQTEPECLNLWPPVLAPHKLVLGRGVRKSLVGSIRLEDGSRQLTYNGWPLYRYAEDTRAKETSNINILQFGGYWPAVSSKSGKFVPTPPSGS